MGVIKTNIMKKLFLIFPLLISVSLSGSVYYIAPTGNDAAAGDISPSTL